ncbi:MAG TPA: protease, partial [Bacteroidales bacterium]|nr:protease [Bacteroidales bacterium]
PEHDKIYTGLLGAKLSRDASGYYKIDKILKGENWYNNMYSPLTEIGVDIKEGDYIISINHTPVNTVDNIYQLLVDKANKPIEIGFSTTPDNKNIKTAIIKPIADEKNLYYYNWVQKNIKTVTEKTNGQVGYIHIPDMVTEGLNEFVKYFYPQLNKRALIIDDRGNGGGNVSPMIIDRLRREITRANISRNQQIPEYTPQAAFVGPKVLLINQYSASDGDLFPYSFKKHKLGKVIGVRSWGGVVGIRGPLSFVDGGYLYKPEFASYSAEKSKWIIEGYGVDPDIIVDNDPYKEYMGEDAQLNKAIEVIMEDLKKWPENKVPSIPKPPDKSK